MDFVDPPVTKKGAVSEKWLEIARALQAHPNEWGLVGDFTPGVATHLRRGTYPAFMDGFSGEHGPQATLYMKSRWEITTRKIANTEETGGTRQNIYMKWIG